MDQEKDIEVFWQKFANLCLNNHCHINKTI